MCDVDAYEAESQTMPELRASYVVVRTISGAAGGAKEVGSIGQVCPGTKYRNTDY